MKLCSVQDDITIHCLSTTTLYETRPTDFSALGNRSPDLKKLFSEAGMIMGNPLA
jgi:hypothetical protein